MNKWNPKANDIFSQAVEMSDVSDRQQFIEDKCGQHELLRRDVESLLAAYEEEPTFLNVPIVKRVIELDAHGLDIPLSGNLKVRLVDMTASSAATDWQFAPGKAVQVGRSSNNDIQLQNMHVSRYHATLSHDGCHWVCTHVGQTGVFYRGRCVDEIRLADGMILQFAKNGLSYYSKMVPLDEGQKWRCKRNWG